MLSNRTRRQSARWGALATFSALATTFGLALLNAPHVQAQSESAASASGTAFNPNFATNEAWHFYQDLAPWTAAISGNQSDLTQITSDRDSSVSMLSFIVDTAGAVQGVAFASTPASGPASIQNFSLQDIQTGNGVVLMRAQGHDVFFLRGTINSAAGSGNVTIRYLANGLWGTYKECPAKVSRSNDGVWHIINSISGNVVNAAFVETWNMGVTTVHGICTTSVNN